MTRAKGQTIAEENPDPRYFAMIPRMASAELDPYELALYCHYKQAAAEHGKCYKSNPTLAKETKMSINKMKQARKSLEKKGYITCLHRLDENGIEHATVEVRIVNVWAENDRRYNVGGSHVVTGGGHEMTGGSHVVTPNKKTLRKRRDKNSVPSIDDTGGAVESENGKNPSERKKVARSDIFCTIARESFQIFDVDNLSREEVILINKVVKWLRENSPGATLTTLMEFYKWYDKAIRVSRPRDVTKFGLRFTEFRQQHLAVQAARSPEMDAQAKLKQLKADETRRERERIAQLSQPAKEPLDESA